MMLISITILSGQLLLAEFSEPGNRGEMIFHRMMLISLTLFSGQLLPAEGNRGPRSGGFNSHAVSGQLLLAERNRGEMIFHIMMLISITVGQLLLQNMQKL